MRSSVEIYDMETRKARVVLQTDVLVEAPNWLPDGSALIVNGDGGLFRIDLERDEAAEGFPRLDPINTEFATSCNNDHGVSPCGREIVISDQSETGQSQIYRVPIEGGTPVPVTNLAPSYWHGWSPDGATLAYCGARAGVYDIYTISRDGGEETRLTDGLGHADGPDYSPCGTWIYFNSSRGDSMQIWRMRTDGSDLTQLTFDERVNWFPHPAPVGGKLVYLAYEAGVTGHPRDKTVELRLMDEEGQNMETLLSLFGGQGTINVPSWAPDGSAFAFVRYEPEE
ncbi:TolB family protein [Roseibium sp.]|uniref:TolB family protein n=1 Tax=Roseibium sp. TaxID=1936156 RepID=UPI003A982F1D